MNSLSHPSIYVISRRLLHHFHHGSRIALPRTCTNTTSFSSLCGSNQSCAMLLTFTRRHLFRGKVAKLVASSKKSLRSMKKRCAPVVISRKLKRKQKTTVSPKAKAKASRRPPLVKKNPMTESKRRVRKINSQAAEPSLSPLVKTSFRKTKRHEKPAKALPTDIDSSRVKVVNTQQQTKKREATAEQQSLTEPTIPRKPTPYITFVSASFATVSDEIKSTLSKVSTRDHLKHISAELSQRWKQMSSEQRSEWQRRADEKHAATLACQTNNTSSPIRARREHTTNRKPSVYASYVQACYSEASATVSSNVSVRERMGLVSRYIGAKWKQSTPEQRLACIQAYQKGSEVGCSPSVVVGAPATTTTKSTCNDQQELISPTILGYQAAVDSFTNAAHVPEAANFTTSTTIIDPHMLSRVSHFSMNNTVESIQQPSSNEVHVSDNEALVKQSPPTFESAVNPKEVETASSEQSPTSENNQPNTSASPSNAAATSPMVSFFTQSKNGYW